MSSSLGGKISQKSVSSTADGEASNKNDSDNIEDGKKRDKPPTETAAGDKVCLQRTMGLGSACGFLITVIVGSGIFVSPSEVALPSDMPIAAIAVWFLTGCFIILVSYCYSELGIIYPEAGGEYVYLRKIFGDYFGFLYIWMSGLIQQPAAISVISLALANYMCSIFNHTPSTFLKQVIASIMILIFTLVNCVSIRISNSISNSTTIIKCSALMVIIAAGIVYVVRGNTENLTWSALTTHLHGGMSAGQLAMAFYSCTFTFSGFQFLNIIVEELKNPSRNLPLSLFISIPIITVLYTGANIVYFAVLGGKQVIFSTAVASDTAHKTLPFIAFAIPICVSISCIGSLSGSILSISRVWLSASRNGHMPHFFSGLHPTITSPIPALVFQAVVTIGLIWITDISFLIPIVGFVISVITFLTIIGLLKLRFTNPEIERKIKPFIGIPIFVAICALGIIIFSFTQGSKNVIISTVITLCSLPIYLICVFWKNKPACYNNLSNSVCKIIMDITRCVPEGKSEAHENAESANPENENKPDQSDDLDKPTDVGEPLLSDRSVTGQSDSSLSSPKKRGDAAAEKKKNSVTT